MDYYLDIDDRLLHKWERRDRELNKRKYGMRMDGKGTRLLASLSTRKYKNYRKRGQRRSARNRAAKAVKAAMQP